MGQQQVVGTTVEPWTLGFLFDVIFTRDTWMHRIDICRAVGAEPMVREEHDGIIVANVVEEWAGRHGQAFDLILTGPAGGRWERGGAEPMTLDAVEFCWLLSGRGEGEGLLATEVPF